MVCALRSARSVSRDSRKAFERPDPNDPTLAVDNLSDLLPSQAASEVDSTVAVTALQDLFAARPARSVPIADASLAAASGPALEADGLDGYFPDRHEAPTHASDDESGPRVEGPCVESEIHRAAMEFLRFAEKFHAFTSECQRGGN